MPSTPPPVPAGCPVHVLDPSGSAPHSEPAGLRGRGTAVRVELPGGVIAWSVTRYEVIKDLLADPRVSRDFKAHWPGHEAVPESWPLAALVLMDSFLNAYGEEHRRLRRTVTPAFTPRRVKAMEPRIHELARTLVADLGRTPPGETADLRASLSRPLTMAVICDLLGIPEHMRGPVVAAIDSLLDTTVDAEQAMAARVKVDERFGALLKYKRNDPAQDLTTEMLNPAEGPPLTDKQARDTLFLMIGAGFETTVNMMTSAAHSVLSDPILLDRACRGEADLGEVVEESLRRDGPIMHMPLRYAIEDIDLGEGVVIGRGEPIVVAFGASGRDPQMHPDNPDTFDPGRASKEHLSFGHGAHFCMGSHLARTEARLGLAELFRVLPDITLAEAGRKPSRVISLIVNGASELPVVPRPTGSTA